MRPKNAALFIALLLAGCDDPIVAGPVAVRPAVPVAPAPVAPPAAEAPDAGAPAPLAVLDDSVFVEQDVLNRDPFRSFADDFVVRANADTVQRRVLLPDVSVDEMRLVAIVSGVSQPRAMVLDPASVGWVLKRGDFIGRAEIVQVGSGDEGTPITLNWRVDRIRDDQIVLTREDPTAPDRPPLTRVIPLHPDQATNPLLGAPGAAP